LHRAQSKADRDPAKGDDLLETSLRVLQEQDDELQEARQEKERTERENRQLRHQMENLCTDLDINRSLHVCLPRTSSLLIDNSGENRKTLMSFEVCMYNI